MTYVCWTIDDGLPRILGLHDKEFVTIGVVKYHTRKQFEKIVGAEVANAALKQYYIEQKQLSEDFRQGRTGRA
ncbi:MAG TPA: hypothetical protein VIU43_02315 [Nitrosospira sp.]